MKKLLYITPHLSTGGLPQYLLKKIETFNNQFEIWCIEWSNYSNDFVVQKNKIKNILGNKLITLNDDKKVSLDIITKINPDIIHIEEIPETFINSSILDTIYNNKRNYNIVVTTHSSNTDPSQIKWTADKFILVSEWSKEVFTNFYKEQIPCDIWEYPIEKKVVNKEKAKIKLGFDTNYKHVLNVGLFTPGKNQGELIEIARKLKDYPIIFHFVGNQAVNFQDYWKPLMENLPNNCIIHGEKSNVEDYLEASDAFYFTSNFELNPLVVKESLSFGLPTFIKKLPTYKNTYDNKVNYIKGDIEEDYILLLKEIFPENFIDKIKACHLLVDTNSDREKASIKSMSRIKEHIDYIQCVNIRYEGDDWKKQAPLNGWENHGPGHWGCFQAHKKAILENFTDDIDGLLIFESDCVIDIQINEFVSLVKKSMEFCEKNKIPYLSFGPQSINGQLISPKLGEDKDFPEFLLTNKIIECHCILLTKFYKDYLFDCIKKTWDATDYFYNSIWQKKNQKIGIIKNQVAYQEEGMSMIDNKFKNGFKSNNLTKNILVISCGRRLEYFKSTIERFVTVVKNHLSLFDEVWILDDRSSNEDKFEMNRVLEKHFTKGFNFISFGKNEEFYFVNKFNFIKKISDIDDIIFLLEDDWLLEDGFNLEEHLIKLRNTNYTQISFSDPFFIQTDEIKEESSVDDEYWSNPFPKNFRHPYKHENGTIYWSEGRINNYTNNPSIIKARIFHENDFKLIKNFEGDFADRINGKHLFTKRCYFLHIGEKSLINSL